MTQKFIRWNCPRCDKHNVAAVAEGVEPGVLSCEGCHYVNDPLDDTWPRPEGWAEEGSSAPTLRMTRRPGNRQTPG